MRSNPNNAESSLGLHKHRLMFNFLLRCITTLNMFIYLVFVMVLAPCQHALAVN